MLTLDAIIKATQQMTSYKEGSVFDRASAERDLRREIAEDDHVRAKGVMSSVGRQNYLTIQEAIWPDTEEEQPMLKETTNSAFQIGDTVVVSATGQSGKIIAFESGRWKVKVDGGVAVLKEATEIERRQILLG